MSEVEFVNPVRLFHVPMQIPYSSAAVHMARVKLSERLMDAGYRNWAVHKVLEHSVRKEGTGCVIPILIRFNTTIGTEHIKDVNERLDKQLTTLPKLWEWWDTDYHKVEN